MPHAPSAAASCEWGYDAVARLRRAVGSTLVLGRDAGGSGVPPACRQQGRVESRHALLRSAYRVMAECRRSATMSADVGGDGMARGDGAVMLCHCCERR